MSGGRGSRLVRASGLDVFAYFNNDVGGHAPRDAMRLRNRVKPRRVA